MRDESTELTGPCGLYCALCSDYQAGACPGCRPIEGSCRNVEGVCGTYACSQARGVTFCFECSGYPCAKLAPAVDGADRLPHNIKMFNLAHIQRRGLAGWPEKASEIRRLYFQGKMVIGQGPRID
jgi:hypothetical protein